MAAAHSVDHGPKMKAVLFSIGTRGDIEPFLAIAELLREKGWNVLCVFPEQFRETVEEMGFSFKGFNKDFLELLDGRDAKIIMGGQSSIFKRIRILIKMSRIGMKLSKDIIALQHHIQMEEKPDRVIYHPKCNFSLVWGMVNNGKSVMVSPIPGMAHSIDHLSALWGNYGGLLNRLSFLIVNMIKSMVLRKISQQYSNEYGGLKITAASIKTTMLEKEKTLYTISESLFPKPAYWPSNAIVAGYYERDKTGDWKPDETLSQFLSANARIVFVSFGSMSNPNPSKITSIIVEVLKRNNISAIVNTAWGGLEKVDNCPGGIYFTNNIPYHWLFPKMYAIVHHGGSGTTHSALKYACPALVIPHAIDQFFWARTISAMKLGPEAISIRKLNRSNFEERLLDLLSNATYKTNARSVSEKMKSESRKEKLYKLITG